MKINLYEVKIIEKNWATTLNVVAPDSRTARKRAVEHMKLVNNNFCPTDICKTEVTLTTKFFAIGE